MPTALDVYVPLYRAGLERTWRVCRRAPWTLLIPVVILAASAVLERYVVPLHDLAHWAVAGVKAIAWGGAFWVLTRLVIGARTEFGDAVTAVGRRMSDVPALAWSALSGTLVFVSLEVGGCLGLSVLSVASATPVIEYVLFEGHEVSDAVRHAWDFATDRWVAWALPQLTALAVISFAWLVLVGLSSLLLSLFDERLMIFADLGGALLFGPVVMLLLVQRGVMFLELGRLTHRQRMFQARM